MKIKLKNKNRKKHRAVFLHQKTSRFTGGGEEYWGENKGNRKRKIKKDKRKKKTALTAPTCSCTNSRIEV